MKAFASFFARAALTAGLAGFSAPAALAAQGQDFPNTTCTCKGCASGGGDVTGQCGSVCKNKTVYAAGSEPHDYCKAAARVTGNEVLAGLSLAGMTVEQLANFSQVDPSTIKEMIARGSDPVLAEGETVRKVIQALKVNGGVEFTEDGVRLERKPRPSRY
jgi:hypothetical protein